MKVRWQATRGEEGAVPARLIAAAAFLLVAAFAVAAWAQDSGPVVSFAGAFDQDGCPDCCNFSCRLTPTPTPEFDPLGRRVFQRSAGRFLLIVEGALGESFRPPSRAGTRNGDNLEPLGGFARPGLQILFGNDLGDGSSEIECGTSAAGGIPAWVGLDEGQTTDAMLDAACRFEWVPASDPCTRDRNGSFSTISGDSILQYCFQIPQSAEFPPGETVAQIRIRDDFGNVGPAEEIVIRVGTPAPTPTPLPGDHTVGGSISHYGNGQPVADVTLESSFGPSAISDGGGGYSVSGLPTAPIEISPFRDGGVGAAVSALDAAYVLQATAGMRQLTDLQRLACDVTGDGTVSSLDASQLLKLQVGLIDRLPVTDESLCDSDWAFVPFAATVPNQTAVAPEVGGGQCRAGALRYEPLSGDATNQSFLAVPFGDCTSNWQPNAAAATSAVSLPPVRLGRVRVSRSGTVKVPLYLAGVKRLRSAQVEVAFDPSLLRARATRRSRALGDGLLVENRLEPGLLRLAIASPDAVDLGRKPLAVLRFRAVRGRRSGLRPAVSVVSSRVDERQ